MSRYVLMNQIRLRSWWLIPYAFLRDGDDHPTRLGEEEFNLLRQCDGRTEHTDSALLDSLLRRGLIRSAENGEVTESFRLPRVYDNRFVPSLALTITTYCNFNCLHCYEAADNEIVRHEMSLADCRRIIDEAADCGILRFKITGGEPMMHRHFLDIVQYVYEKGMSVRCIYTNGYFITPDKLERLREIDQQMQINVSYDGAGFHDWMRGKPGAEKDLLEKIRLCVTYGFPVRVSTNLNRVNLPSLYETTDTMEALGVEELRVIRTSETPRWLHHAGDTTLPLEEYFEILIGLCARYASKDRRMKLNLWQFAVIFPESRAYSMMPVACSSADYSPSMPPCATARDYITVLPDGSVFPCSPSSGVYMAHHVTFENALKSGLKPILQDSRYLSVSCLCAHRIAEHDPKCGVCRYFRQCLGGCRVLALALNHDILSHDPSKCVFFENRYDLRLKEALSDYRCLNEVDCE